MDERRREVRRRPSLELLVWDLNTSQFLGRMENVSPEGTMLICNRPVGPGAFFRCRIEWPEAAGPVQEIKFDAQSMWCRPCTGTETYEVGFHVPNFTPAQLNTIGAITQKPGVKS